MENFRVVNLFLETNKTKRTEKIPGILTKVSRDEDRTTYMSDFGIPYITSPALKNDTRLLYVYVHDCAKLNAEVMDKQQLGFFKLDCLELTKRHIESMFLFEDNEQSRQRLIIEYQNKLYNEYKKLKVEGFLPFKQKKDGVLKRLLTSF